MASASERNRPPFKVRGTATIKHLNVRKEGPEDEKILAVDVKLEVRRVDRTVCDYFEDPGVLAAFLWRGDSDALIARNMHLGAVCYANEIEGATFEIGSEVFDACDVKKFSLEPLDGGVLTLGCTVTIFSPPDVQALARYVQDDATVRIESAPDLFTQDTKDGARAAANKLDKALARDGVSATLMTDNGQVLATFGAAPPPDAPTDLAPSAAWPFPTNTNVKKPDVSVKRGRTAKA